MMAAPFGDESSDSDGDIYVPLSMPLTSTERLSNLLSTRAPPSTSTDGHGSVSPQSVDMDVLLHSDTHDDSVSIADIQSFLDAPLDSAQQMPLVANDGSDADDESGDEPILPLELSVDIALGDDAALTAARVATDAAAAAVQSFITADLAELASQVEITVIDCSAPDMAGPVENTTPHASTFLATACADLHTSLRSGVLITMLLTIIVGALGSWSGVSELLACTLELLAFSTRSWTLSSHPLPSCKLSSRRWCPLLWPASCSLSTQFCFWYVLLSFTAVSGGEHLYTS